MNKAFLAIITIVAGIALFAGGIFFSQVSAQSGGPGWMMDNFNGSAQYGPGMMENGMHGPGMMGNDHATMMENGMHSPGMMGSDHAAMMENGMHNPDMMDDTGHCDMMDTGMMGSANSNTNP